MDKLGYVKLIESIIPGSSNPCMNDLWLEKLRYHKKRNVAISQDTQQSDTLVDVNSVEDKLNASVLSSLSDILLTMDNNSSSVPSNTTVNDIEGLQLPSEPPTNKDNIPRLLMCNAFRTTIQKIRGLRLAGSTQAATTSGTSKIEKLLKIVYAQRCESDPNFVSQFLKSVQGAEDEYAEKLERMIQFDDNTARHSISVESPPQAFVSMALVDLQINSLEQSMVVATPQVAVSILKSTCGTLNTLFQSMPLGSLSDVAEWEHQIIEKMSSKLVEFAERIDNATGSRECTDQVYLLLLGLAIQRGSLSAFLRSLDALISVRDTTLSQVHESLLDLFNRLLQADNLPQQTLDFLPNATDSIEIRLKHGKMKGKDQNTSIQIRRIPQMGDMVRSKEGVANPCLASGQTGHVVADDRIDKRFLVFGPNGTCNYWFSEDELEVVCSEMVHDVTRSESANTRNLVIPADSIAVSEDGRVMYVCGASVDGIMKLGTGLSCWGQLPLPEGEVLCERDIGLHYSDLNVSSRVSITHCALIQNRVFVFKRGSGGTVLCMDEYDAQTLLKTQETQCPTRLELTSHIIKEQYTIVKAQSMQDVMILCRTGSVVVDVQKSMCAIAWQGNGTSWVTGNGNWYYEVGILESGRISVGWATPAFFNAESRMGDIKDSTWLFNATEASKMDENGSVEEWGERCHVGDIIGCALTMDSAHQKIEMRFSRNGRWINTSGLAFEFESSILFVRPVVVIVPDTPSSRASVSISCGEYETHHSLEERPTLDVVSYRYAPPNEHFRPVSICLEDDSANSKSNSDQDDKSSGDSGTESTYMDESWLGPLPPMCHDDRFVYILSLEKSLLPSVGVDSIYKDFDIIVHVYDPIKACNLVHVMRFQIPDDTTENIFPNIDNFMEWKCCCNGSDLVILHDERQNSVDRPSRTRRMMGRLNIGYRRGTGRWRSHRKASTVAMVLPTSLDYLIPVDSLDYSRSHNMCWSWNAEYNICRSVANAGVPLNNRFERREWSPTTTINRVEFCGAMLSAVARLSQPLQPVSAPRGVFSSKLRSRFAEFADPVATKFSEMTKAITMKSLAPEKSIDLFLEARPATFRYLSNLLRAFAQINPSPNRDYCIFSLLSLLSVNVHALDMMIRRDPIGLMDNEYLCSGELVETCRILLWGANESPSLQSQVATSFLQCIDQLLRTTRSKVEYLKSFLSWEGIFENAERNRMLNGILQSIAVDALFMPFADFFILFEPCTARLLDFCLQATYRRIDKARESLISPSGNSDGSIGAIVNVFLCLVLSAFSSKSHGDTGFLGQLIEQILDKCSAILESAANVGTMVAAMPMSDERLEILVDAVKDSLVGMLLPSMLSSLELSFRSRSEKKTSIDLVKSIGGSMGYVAMFIGQLLRFSAMVTSRMENLIERLRRPSEGTMSKSLKKRRHTLHAAANAAINQSTSTGLSTPQLCRYKDWTKIMLEFESPHDYENEVSETTDVIVEGASALIIEFDPRSCTERNRDYVEFLPFVVSEETKDDAQFGIQYSGDCGWPGTGDTPVLIIKGDRFKFKFVTDASEVEWGYRFTVTGILSQQYNVICKPWFSHLTSISQDLISSIIHAMLGTHASLHDAELQNLRWVQNPIFSGGLKASQIPGVDMNGPATPSTPTTPAPLSVRNPSTRLRRLSSSRSRTPGLTEDERKSASTLLSDLLSDQFPIPGVGGALFNFLRSKRVMFDQGLYTHRAASSLLATLIHAKGYEREAIQVANSGDAALAAAKLVKLWTACQHIRTWINNLVVNDQVRDFIDTCTSGNSAADHRIKELLDDPACDDPEVRQYNAMCELVSTRAKYLINDIERPVSKMLALRSSGQDAARARWHRLRRHYCPKIQKLVQDQKSWAIALYGAAALRKNTSITVTKPTAHDVAIPRTPRRNSFQRLNSMEFEIDDEKYMTPSNRRMRAPPLVRLGRSASRGFESPMHTPKPVSSVTASTPMTSAGSKHFSFNFQGSARRRERLSGGFRRNPTTASIESETEIDRSFQEHEQSIAESIVTFLKSKSAIDTEMLSSVLKLRNDRATTRAAGLEFINALLNFARSHSKYLEGKKTLDMILISSARAFRGFDLHHNLNETTGGQIAEFLWNQHNYEVLSRFKSISDEVYNSGVTSEHEVIGDRPETHYLTDLSGCCTQLRDYVTSQFYKFLYDVTAFLKLATRQHEAANNAVEDADEYRDKLYVLLFELDRQIRYMMNAVSLDYVEGDFRIIQASDLVSSLRSVLLDLKETPLSKSVHDVAWQCFVLLVRRCICESGHTGNRFSSGNSVQQSLLDVLMQVLEKSLADTLNNSSPGSMKLTADQNGVFSIHPGDIHFKHNMVTLVAATPACFTHLKESFSFSLKLKASADFVIGGRLMSFGNPQVQGGSSIFGTQMAATEQSSAHQVFQWLETCLEEGGFISLSSGNVDGLQIKVTSKYSISDLKEASFFFEVDQTGTVKLLTSSSSGEFLEIFRNVFYEIAASRRLKPFVGDRVRITSGNASGFCGTVLGTTDTDVLVVLRYNDEPFLINIDINLVTVVPPGTPHLTQARMNSSLKKLISSSRSKPIIDQICTILDQMGSSEVAISRAIQLFKTNCENDIEVDDDDASVALVDGPIYIGSCPLWGMGIHRKVAENVLMSHMTVGAGIDGDLEIEEENIVEIGLNGDLYPVPESSKFRKPIVEIFNADPFAKDSVERVHHKQAHDVLRALETLRLAAEVSLSPVGRSRLTAPDPWGMLLRNALCNGIALEVRIASIRILGILLHDISPAQASNWTFKTYPEHHESKGDSSNWFIEHVGTAIGECMNFMPVQNHSFSMTGEAAATIALRLVEMLHGLCAKEAWAASIAQWTRLALSQAKSIRTEDTAYGGVLQQNRVLAGLAILGGLFSQPLIGSRALSSTDGIVSKSEVVILAKVPEDKSSSTGPRFTDEQEPEPTDITSRMRASASSNQQSCPPDASGPPSNVLDGTDAFWESNGYIPHWIQLTCPSSFAFKSISILTEQSFESYSPTDVEIRLGSSQDNLRTIRNLTLELVSQWVPLVTESDILSTDRVFRMEITSNHSGGCDSRIKQFRVTGIRRDPESANGGKYIPIDKFWVCNLNGTALKEETVPRNEDTRIMMMRSSELKVMRSVAPPLLIERLSTDIVHSLVGILKHTPVSLFQSNIRARSAKIVSILIENPTMVGPLGDLLLPHMVNETKAFRETPFYICQNIAWNISESVATKWRMSLTQHVELKQIPKQVSAPALCNKQGDILTFESTGKIDRLVTVKTGPMLSGRYKWSFKLLDDANGDETSVFGISTWSHGNKNGIKLLKPSSDHWLIQSYNGHRYHSNVPSQWDGSSLAKIHPGDTVSFLLDLNRRVLFMAVNENPFMKVFRDVSTDQHGGIYPVVGCYGNHSAVRVQLTSFMTDVRSCNGDIPFESFVLQGTNENIEERAGRLSTILYEHREASLFPLKGSKSDQDISPHHEILPAETFSFSCDSISRDDVDPADIDSCDVMEGSGEIASSAHRNQKAKSGSSKQILQTISALYEISDSSCEHSSNADTSRAMVMPDVHLFSTSVLSHPWLFQHPSRVVEMCQAFFDEIYQRFTANTLGRVIVEWSSATSKALPEYMLTPHQADLTLNLLYQSAIDSGDSLKSIETLLFESNEGVLQTAVNLCFNSFITIGSMLTQSVRSKSQELQSLENNVFDAITTDLQENESSPIQAEQQEIVDPEESSFGASSAMPYQHGDLVSVRRREGVAWSSGKVVGIHMIGVDAFVFDIQYDNGDFERNVAEKRVTRSEREERTPAKSLRRSTPQVEAESPPDESPPPAEDRLGNYLLISDRYKRDIPASGKADTAQVSIINVPAPVDGIVKSVLIRLAEPPAGGQGMWELHVFERAGDTGTFFVAEGTTSKPTSVQLSFDAHSQDLQEVQVPGTLYVRQGQYIGVSNPHGRLNVAYTPGKKKSGESWAVKPVEVFYLMPKDLKEPLGTGPHKARKWHGRAGWCATMLMINPPSLRNRPFFLEYEVESTLQRMTKSGVSFEDILKQSCWFLRCLSKERIVGSIDLLDTPQFVQAIRRLLEYGIFIAYGEHNIDNTSPLVSVWVPLMELITELCTGVVEEQLLETPLSRQGTESLIHLQAVLEAKMNIMNLRRQKKFRDSQQTSSRLATMASQNLDDSIGSISSSGRQDLVVPTIGRTVVSDSRETDAINNNPGNASDQGTLRDIQMPTSDSDTLMSNIHFQKLLQCLLSVDDLTRKDGLDGELFLVDSPRRSGGIKTSWEEFEIVFLPQRGPSPRCLQFAIRDSGIFVHKVIDAAPNADQLGDTNYLLNCETALKHIMEGDELIGVFGHYFKDISVPSTKIHLQRIGINGLVKDDGSSETSGIPFDTDFSRAYNVNGVLFPPCLEIAMTGHGAGEENYRGGSETRDTWERLKQSDSVKLTFRRPTSEMAQKTNMGVSYKGVTQFIDASKYSPCFAIDETRLLGDSEWLDAVVTSMELLKSLALKSLLPTRFSKEQYILWYQRKNEVEVQTEHPFESSNVLLSTHIPDASSLELRWDSRSSLGGNLTIGVRGCDETTTLVGQGPYPPNVSVLSGNQVQIFAANEAGVPVNASELDGHPALLMNSRGEIVVAGLANRASAYMWLGTVKGFKSKFYCGRPWTHIVGWSENNGRCGPHGGAQCPDCAVFTPENILGSPMKPGRAPSQSPDLLYCAQCKSTSQLPCIACRRYLTVMARTACYTRVILKFRDSFETNVDYARYMSGVVVPGIYVRIVRHSSSRQQLSPGSVGRILKVSYSKLVCNFKANQGGTFEVPLHLIELLLPRDYEAQDFRFENEEGLEATDVLDTITSTSYLEFTDFSTVGEYNDYMVQKCKVGMRIRCSKAYESVEEGDVGVISRVDIGDDLPCQVMWENLNAHYWLPWAHLSLNEKPFTNARNTGAGGASDSRMSESNISFLVPNWSCNELEICNAGRTVVRKGGSGGGFGTQRANHYVDRASKRMNVTVQLATRNELMYVGVISEHFSNQENPRSSPLNKAGSWSLRSDGKLFVDGVPSDTVKEHAKFEAEDTITIIVDTESRSLTFMRDSVLLESITGIPARVALCVSLSCDGQLVGIQKGGIGTQMIINPINQWGLRVKVRPLYDVSHINDEKSLISSGFNTYLGRQNSWSRKSDELLVSFVNDVESKCQLELEDLLNMRWDDIYCISDAHMSASSSGSDTNLSGSGQILWNLVLDRYHGIYGETKGIDDQGVRDMLDDIGQRFDLLRALNKSIYDSLGLLDLTSWRDADTSAAFLSECSFLIFNKFKVPMWQDALATTQAEDIHKFEVVLDFGRAAARAHVPDIHGRHTVFAQAFRVIHQMPPKTLRAHDKLYRCVMRGMASHDDGGPYRQSFTQYCAELQSVPGVGLLLPCSNRVNGVHTNRDRWLPNPAANSPVQISMFEFFGKLLGIAIRNQELLDLRLPSLMWKPLVNQVPTVDDLRAVDYLTVVNCEKSGVELADGITFTTMSLDGREVELVPGGSQVSVTAANFADWADLTLFYKLHEFDEQINAIRRGIATIVPQRLLMLFRWDELELMVCGRPILDMDLLKQMTVYHECRSTDRHVRLFWEALESFSEEQRSEYIKFVWGRARLPSDKHQWEHPHIIATLHPSRSDSGILTPVDLMLPYAHTCYFKIDIPEYSTLEIMKSRLLYAIENCAEIDGDTTTTGRRIAAMGFAIDEDDDNDDDGDDEEEEDDQFSPVPDFSPVVSPLVDEVSSNEFGLPMARRPPLPGRTLGSSPHHIVATSLFADTAASFPVMQFVDPAADPFGEYQDGAESSSDVSSH